MVRSRAQSSGFHFSHLEFEPSGPAVAPNPTGSKIKWHSQSKDHVSITLNGQNNIYEAI